MALHVNVLHTLHVGAMQYITCNLYKACFGRIFQSRRDTPDLSLFVFSFARAPGKTSKDISPAVNTSLSRNVSQSRRMEYVNTVLCICKCYIKLEFTECTKTFLQKIRLH